MLFLAAVPTLRRYFFTETMPVNVRGVQHLLVGVDKNRPGASKSRATICAEFLCNSVLKGVSMNVSNFHVTHRSLPDLRWFVRVEARIHSVHNYDRPGTSHLSMVDFQRERNLVV